MSTIQSSSPYKGSGSLTKEQFLFYEMRTTAKLLEEGLDDKEIMNRILEENLFQYPTEKSIRSIARSCIARLRALNDSDLVSAVASQPSDTAKQICLYAMMKQYRLVWDFMITVVGEKYRMHDESFGKLDINTFFLQLQEQDDLVAGWSEQTITKVKQVIMKLLVENEYIDNLKATRLNPVLLCSVLENAIRSSGDSIALPAFNCFS